MTEVDDIADQIRLIRDGINGIQEKLRCGGALVGRQYAGYEFRYSPTGINEGRRTMVIAVARDIAEAATLAGRLFPASDLSLLSYGEGELRTARLLELRNGEAIVIFEVR